MTDPAPGVRPRAVVLSFDNLGEASELERGTWDDRARPRGHESVTLALPRLLDELDALGLVATFFVEAINCRMYPRAMREIADRGHELGVHGWRHESWAELSRDRERQLLLAAGRAFRELGFPAQAFRPPGGRPTAATLPLLHELGYRWWSPAAEAKVGEAAIATIPFDWELVDAYYLMDSFEQARARQGDSRAPLRPDMVAERLALELANGSGMQTLIFHPFLMLDSDWWEGARRVLALIAQLHRENRAWVGPGRELTEPRT